VKAKYWPVIETFSSWQGEGPNAGRWAAFVRFTGCNLRCEWGPGQRCDTPYTSFEAERGSKTPADVRRFLANHRKLVPQPAAPLVVLTGGEPTLHRAFRELLAELADSGDWDVEVETNGTGPVLPDHPGVRWVVSPKDLAVPENPRLAAVHRNNMGWRKWFDDWRRECAPTALHRPVIKLVVDPLKPSLYRTYLTELAAEYGDCADLWVMPAGATTEDQVRVLAPLFSFLQTVPGEPFRVSTRLHILAWGLRRGV
jgi:organic radical activating enzyme